MIPRQLHQHLLRMAGMFPVITLTGPRQSGKTTLVKAVFPSHTYINLENLDDRAAAAEDPRLFLSRYKKHGVIIDEAQRVPELFSFLQEIVDESGIMGRYILTGSQNFLLMEQIAQSLAGRVAVTNLLQFTYNELSGNAELRSIDDILYTGMFPAIYDRDIPAEYYYPSYLQTYIERDVRSLKNIGNLDLFRRFLQLCAGRTGQLLNLSAIGAEAGIDHKTVRSWLSVLEAGFVIFLLPPYFRNFNKRIVKNSKLYFYDTGIVCSLLGLNSAQYMRNFYMRGSLFENYVIAEYLKMGRHQGKIPNIYFWRDNTGNEIDMLIDQGDALHAVEIKSGTTIRRDFFYGLRKFKKYSGISTKNCYLVYGGDKTVQRKDGLIFDWRSIYLLPGL